jgi:hypothetical protein
MIRENLLEDEVKRFTVYSKRKKSTKILTIDFKREFETIFSIATLFR